MSFTYSATPNSKESFQLFRITVAIFLAYSYIVRYYNRNYRVIGIVIWYTFVIKIYNYMSRGDVQVLQPQ